MRLSPAGDEGFIDRISQKTTFSVLHANPSKDLKYLQLWPKPVLALRPLRSAEQLQAKLILAETLTGSTALSISSLRPSAPIIISSPNRRVCNQSSIVWGGKPFLVSKGKHSTGSTSAMLRKLKERGSIQVGDWVVEAHGQNR